MVGAAGYQCTLSQLSIFSRKVQTVTEMWVLMRSQLIWGCGTDVEQQDKDNFRLFVPREHRDCTRARFLDAELPFCLADIIRQNTEYSAAAPWKRRAFSLQSFFQTFSLAAAFDITSGSAIVFQSRGLSML
jgi:hypothetical protein